MFHRFFSKPTVICSVAAIALLQATAHAQSLTYSQVVQADTFVSSGQPTVNFGTMGAMEIASPTAAQNRTEESLMRFDTTAMDAAFNTAYGVGGWAVTGVTLQLYSNSSQSGVQPNNSSLNVIAAGGFEFDWLSNNGWTESGANGITWNTLSTILPGTGNNALQSLGQLFWPATGATSSLWNLTPSTGLVNNIQNGSQVTIYGQPTSGSSVGYLFNTLNNAPGVLNVTVQAVPEPGTLTLLESGVAGLALWRRRNAR